MTEPWPATVAVGEVLVDDRLTAAVTVQAGALVGLELEQLQQTHRLARRRHDPQGAVRTGKHQPGGVDVEDLDATIREQGEQLDDVEIGDERVGKFDQRANE